MPLLIDDNDDDNGENFCMRLLIILLHTHSLRNLQARPAPTEFHFVIKLPLLSNFCIRLLPLSATYTLPTESMAIAEGELNWPSAETIITPFCYKVAIAIEFLYTVIVEISYIHITR